MKILNRIPIRATIAFLLIILTGCFVWAGVPAIAVDTEVTVIRENSSPIAENLEYSTYRNIAIHGRFSATDPDGDMVMFEIADMPKKGSIHADKNGSFIYMPNEGKKGQDSFSYIAIDNAGNISDKATITITINKQATKLTYADMTDNGSYYSALVLGEKGVFIGEKLGNEYFFRPDGLVTRGEFVAMCLGMSDAQTLQGITRTGFYDDDSMPMWVKPYVSTALMSGIITGYKNDEGQLVFASQEPITFAEAAVVLNNLLKITDVVNVNAVTPDIFPVWAYQAEINVTACNIMPMLGTDSYSRCVTRAEAADMLVSSMNLLKDNNNNGSLLNWAK